MIRLKDKITVALTMGDPSGIGPELIAKSLSSGKIPRGIKFRIYGCPDIIERAFAKFAGASAPAYETVKTGNLKFGDFPLGENNSVCGREAYKAALAATKDTISGINDAVVTAPLSKSAVILSGEKDFTGYTGLAAELCGAANFAMMQSSGNLRVAFVTTHIPLKKVAASISKKRIADVAVMLAESAKADGVKNPKIAIAGLNPHAGENGSMGKEEISIIAPAICEIRKLGIDAEGPFPPDTLFIKNVLKKFDGIVAMYHDQGHIPFKMLAFDRGVNSTLGLPIIRASVDHGTAFDIAWKGEADPGSMIAAIKVAARRAIFKILRKM
jgi:4-hydroxythreonine-4-phosphate dehydrogenase